MDKHREHLIELHVIMYLFDLSQKSKPTKYGVFRDKTLTICNQSPTVLTHLCHYEAASVIMKFVKTSYCTQYSECQN
jgi:hypothetical protein